MELLIVLAIVTLLARLAGQLGVGPLRDWNAAARVGLAAMFCCTATTHFIGGMRADLIRMVPPAIPYPEFMVTFTGICEFAGAVGLLVPRTRWLAAVALIVMLVGLLPANIYAAQAGLTLGGEPVTPLVPRVALQLVFIGLIWWFGIRKGGGRGGGGGVEVKDHVRGVPASQAEGTGPQRV